MGGGGGLLFPALLHTNALTVDFWRKKNIKARDAVIQRPGTRQR